MNISVMLIITFITTYISTAVINLKQFKQSRNKVLGVFPSEKSKIFYCLIMLAYQISLCFVLNYFNRENLCEHAKIICFTSIMWPLAQIDFKQKRIPNKLLLLCLSYRAIILIFEMIFYMDTLKTVILSEVIVLVAVTIIIGICMLVIKNGIGMGDLKLLMVMSLMLSPYVFLNCILLSMIISFFVALYLLIIKKKTKKYDFAFGPMVAVGVLAISLIMG